MLTATNFQGQETTYTYNESGNLQTQNSLTTITNPDGTSTGLVYDTEGRLAKLVQSATGTTTFNYLAGGEVSEIDALGNTTDYYFDYRGLVAKMVDPLGNTTTYSYDNNLDLTKVIDPLGASTSYTYDSEGDKLSVTNPLGQTTTYTYSGPFNELASVTDANGNITQYAYNGDVDLTSTTYADGTIAQLAYDPQGNVISSVDENGNATSYTYNAAGQVTQESFADGTQTTFTYDAYGDMTSATNASGTITLQYNSDQELVKVMYPSGQYLDYTYNAAGQRTQMTDQDGYTVNYTYNAAGQLSELTDGSGNLIVSYTYDADGRLGEQDNGNGTKTTYGYDADSNETSVINYGPNSTVDSSFSYTYDMDGHRITETTIDGQWLYAYDANGQLTQAVFTPNSSDPDGVPSENIQYQYDAVGNRISQTVNGVKTTYTVNDMNEITSSATAGQGTTTYAYDNDGNMVSQTAAGQTTTYTYNAQNQLAGITAPNGSWSYTYDALGARIASTLNGQTTTYLVDPTGSSNVIAQYTTGKLAASYTYGLGLVSQTPASTGTPAYYAFDGTGSTADITGANGAILNSYTYLPFGGTITSTQTVANPFQFVGQAGVTTDMNGLDSMRLRDYSSVLGQFIAPDPLGQASGTIDVRQYVNNSPIDQVDPNGSNAQTIISGLLGGTSGVYTIAAAIVLAPGLGVVTAGAIGLYGLYSAGAGIRNVYEGIVDGKPVPGGALEEIVAWAGASQNVQTGARVADDLIGAVLGVQSGTFTTLLDLFRLSGAANAVNDILESDANAASPPAVQSNDGGTSQSTTTDTYNGQNQPTSAQTTDYFQDALRSTYDVVDYVDGIRSEGTDVSFYDDVLNTVGNINILDYQSDTSKLTLYNEQQDVISEVTRAANGFAFTTDYDPSDEEPMEEIGEDASGAESTAIFSYIGTVLDYITYQQYNADHQDIGAQLADFYTDGNPSEYISYPTSPNGPYEGREFWYYDSGDSGAGEDISYTYEAVPSEPVESHSIVNFNSQGQATSVTDYNASGQVTGSGTENGVPQTDDPANDAYNDADGDDQDADDYDDGGDGTSDPNLMIAPTGVGAENLVSDVTTLPYQIDFENAPTASAPAQSVTITDQLSSNLNWNTFAPCRHRLGEHRRDDPGR